MTLFRLSAAINTARQLAQALRGRGLAPTTADEIAEHLRAAQRLAAGKTKTSPMGDKSKQRPTRRRVLWRKDPRCFWCGRVTVFETHGQPDSATLDHVYPRTHPRRRSTRKHLPSSVLSCYPCNHERGAPEATTTATCPVIVLAEKSRGRQPGRPLFSTLG